MTPPAHAGSRGTPGRSLPHGPGHSPEGFHDLEPAVVPAGQEVRGQISDLPQNDDSCPLIQAESQFIRSVSLPL